MALRDELHRRIDALLEADLSSVADFVGYLEAKRSQAPPHGLTDEDRAWIDAAAEGLGDRMASLESELPPEQVQAWEHATAAAVRSARYVPGRGLVIDG